MSAEAVITEACDALEYAIGYMEQASVNTSEERAALAALRLLAQPAPAQADALRASLEALATEWESKGLAWDDEDDMGGVALITCAHELRIVLAAAGEGGMMPELDENGMPTMAYWPGNPGTPPEVERIRQVFSGLALVRDALNALFPSSDEEGRVFEETDELLRQAHRKLTAHARAVLATESP